ncbi:ROK family protein [Euzebya rosea]|uniref:ROK family protein n=1 Tax=Euzebya rosea TaxID=2052804 RepID=UPI001F0B9EC1|nr:ROK family protein [Euzebya rosea]
MPPVALGIDVGGTKILGALVDDRGTVLQQRVVPTPKEDEPLLQAIVEVASGLLDGAAADLPVGLGFPGLITRDGVARYGPNISLREFPLRARLEDELGRPVLVDNDATAATWAEFVIGAGREARADMLMFTLGTGVGGGLVIGGRIVRGSQGFAGELGHLIIDVDGASGPSGIPGELEAYSAGNAIGRMANHAFLQGHFIGTLLEGAVAPTGEQVTRGALQGVEPAIEILARAGRYLGIAAAGLVNCLDPELIVVGGGAGAAGDLVLEPARAALADHVLGPTHRDPVPVVAAGLGPEAGAIGAAFLAVEEAAGR